MNSQSIPLIKNLYLFTSLLLLGIFSCQSTQSPPTLALESVGKIDLKKSQSKKKSPKKAKRTLPLISQKNFLKEERKLDPAYEAYYTFEGNRNSEEFSRITRRALFNYIDMRAFGLLDNNISILSLDEDDLWMGTWLGGILRYSIPLGQAKLFEKGEKSLAVKNIVDISVKGDDIWITDYNKIRIYNKGNGKWRSLPSGGERVGAFLTPPVFQGEDRVIWGSARYGILQYTPSGWETLNPSFAQKKGEIVQILYDDREYGLMGGTTRNGLLTSDTGLNPLKERLSLEGINDIVSDRFSLYIATNQNGLIAWHRKKNKAESIDLSKWGENFNQVSSLFLSDAYLFVGTNGDGVLVLERRSNRWIPLGFKEGLIGLDISSLIYRNGQLFIAALGQGVTIVDWDEYVRSLKV